MSVLLELPTAVSTPLAAILLEVTLVHANLDSVVMELLALVNYL